MYFYFNTTTNVFVILGGQRSIGWVDVECGEGGCVCVCGGGAHVTCDMWHVTGDFYGNCAFLVTFLTPNMPILPKVVTCDM